MAFHFAAGVVGSRSRKSTFTSNSTGGVSSMTPSEISEECASEIQEYVPLGDSNTYVPMMNLDPPTMTNNVNNNNSSSSSNEKSGASEQEPVVPIGQKREKTMLHLGEVLA